MLIVRLVVLHAVVTATVTAGVGCAGTEHNAAVADSSSAAASTGWVVTEQGIGPLRAGTPIGRASAAVGGGLVVPAGADAAGCTYAEWRGGPPGVRVMVEGGRIARIDVNTPGVATAAGARIGDAEGRVQNLYRGHVAVSPLKYGPGHYLTVTSAAADSGFAIVFETVAGQVTRYRAGRRPQVEYVEGCG